MAECIVESFGCQAFLAGLADPSKNKVRLTILLQRFAELHDAFTGWMSEQELEMESCPTLSQAMNRINIITKGLLAMLSVVPCKHGSTAADANILRSYTGNHLLEATVRDLIKGNKIWTSYFDDLVSKGAATITMGPELIEMSSKLEGEDHLSAQTLRQCASRLPVMKKAMRQGATQNAEKLLFKKVTLMAKEIEGTSGLSLSLLDAVVEALNMFRETTGTLQLLSKVDAYRRQNLSSLSCMEVGKQLALYPNIQTSDVPEDGLWPRLQDLLNAMRQLEELDEEVLPSLKNAMVWHFRVLSGSFEACCLLFCLGWSTVTSH